MTKREKEKIRQAQKNLILVRNLLTIDRNHAHGNEKKQEHFNELIDVIIKTIDLIKPQ